MSASSPMKRLFRLFGHNIYLADKRFLNPGIYIWTGKRNFRVIPFTRWKKEVCG